MKTFAVRVDNLDTRARLTMGRHDRAAADALASSTMAEHAAETGHTLTPPQIFPGASYFYCADCGNVATVAAR